MPDLELDFAAWIDHRDLAALTRVFDATAGRLLLLATHITAPPSAPEDLVQATFMAAMEKGDSWDQSRPIWPWLATILQNEARMDWRRAKRRREVDLDTATQLDTKDSDPATLTASDDAFQAIVRCIDNLPLEYGQVLRLRLVHGLSHGEIAHSLELPVGTVRARTHRGLARLRDALPTGVGTGILAALLANESALLAQVRTRVLEAGELSATPATAILSPTEIGGILTMKAKITLAVAALAVLAIASLLWSSLSASSTGGEDTTIASATHKAEVDQTPTETPPITEAGTRKDLAAKDTAVWPLVGLVITRDRQPVAGARIEISVAPPNINSRPKSLRKVLTVCNTDHEGKFSYDLDALRDHAPLFRAMSYLFVRVSHDGYRRESKIISLPTATETKRFEIEVQLAPRHSIIGRVIDDAGAAVVGASVAAGRMGGPGRSEFGDTSDGEGYFRLRIEPDQLPEMTQVVATHPQYGIGRIPLASSPTEISEAIDIGTISLVRSASIHGRVVMGDGMGLGGFPITAYRITPEAMDDLDLARRQSMDQAQQRQPLRLTDARDVWDRVKTSTDSKGTFTICGLEPDAPYAIAVRDSCFMPVTTTCRAGGEDPVQLVVDRQLILIDVRSESGESLPGARIQAMGFDPEVSRPAKKVYPGFPSSRHRVRASFYPGDSEGRRILLSPFGWTWRIGPTSEVVRPDFVRHDVKLGMHRTQLRVILRPQHSFGALRISLTDENAEPFEPFEVQVRSMDSEASRHVYSRNLKDGLITDLATGRWSILINAGRDLGFVHHSSFDRIRPRGTHQREVNIGANETTDLQLRVPATGLVSFQLKSDPALPRTTLLGVVAQYAGTTRKMNLVIMDQYPGRSLASYPNRYLMIVQDALPPGRHAFSIEVDGFYPARCEAVVEQDRMTRVPVQLLAK